jgi:hypothetical protein
MYVVARFMAACGTSVSVVRSADHVAVQATTAPVTLPSCRTTSISIPDIMARLNFTTIGVATLTLVAALAGWMLASDGASAVAGLTPESDDEHAASSRAANGNNANIRERVRMWGSLKYVNIPE